MAGSNPPLTGLFREVFDLCDLTPDESVVVAHQAESDHEYVDAALGAIETIGANTVSLGLPGLKHTMYPYGGGPLTSLDDLVETDGMVLGLFQEADLVVDMTATGLVHTTARTRTLEAGTRMLTIQEPPEILERMFPRPELRERVERAVRLLADATTMRVTSEAGTDLTLTLAEDNPVFGQYGYTDEAGRWDHFPGGFVTTYPIDESPEGRIVVDSGDVVLPMGRYVENPVTVTVEDGFIRDIEGAGKDQRRLSRYLSKWDEEAAYATSHFGFGLDETAEWETLSFADSMAGTVRGQDARALSGNFMWSTGPNRFADRYTRAHTDVPMRDCTVTVDGETVVRAGTVVHDALRPP